MRPSLPARVVLLTLATVIVTTLAPFASVVLANDLERNVEARWRGAWVLTGLDSYSDCSGIHTDNHVNGTLVSSKGHFRFRPGEMGQVSKINLKHSRLDLDVTFPEPVLMSYQDGPFTLYREVRCQLEFDVELPRSIVSGDDLEGVETALKPVLRRFDSDEQATQSKGFNHRKRDAYPADYETTLARHAAWQVQQANAAIQAKLDRAMEETGRLTDRVSGDPDYLKGFAAGVEGMRAIDLTRCEDLMTRDITRSPAQQTRVAGFASNDSASRYARGFEDGQRLVLGLESIRRLPSCMQQVPDAPTGPGAQRPN